MKKISKEKIKNEVKNAFEVGKDWCSYDPFRCYNIMIDTDDAAIWLDVFLNENDWKVYHSDTIQSLNYLPLYTESGYIDDAIQKLKEAGWTITD